MRPRSRSYLRDALENAAIIIDSVTGKSLRDYEADIRLRHQVEREFMIIDEAIDRLDKLEPQLAARITDFRGYIGLRNVLNHGYPDVDRPTMWRTIKVELPILVRELTELLSEA
ncbi:MAG: DUF86 domain-containing protein [Chloroflexota bacterium]|nr:DUF86 domain-containing protein [Chloroflexota bacterium]MDE2895674.1 DUF86 domain-containing protein [Chloroflexota bacterium]